MKTRGSKKTNLHHKKSGVLQQLHSHQLLPWEGQQLDAKPLGSPRFSLSLLEEEVSQQPHRHVYVTRGA